MAVSISKFMKEYLENISGESIEALTGAVELLKKYKIDNYRYVITSEPFNTNIHKYDAYKCTILYLEEYIKLTIKRFRLKNVIFVGGSFRFTSSIINNKEKLKKYYIKLSVALQEENDETIKIVLKELRNFCLRNNSYLKTVKCYN